MNADVIIPFNIKVTKIECWKIEKKILAIVKKQLNNIKKISDSFVFFRI